jgi:arylsulfatase A-like enzyme
MGDRGSGLLLLLFISALVACGSETEGEAPLGGAGGTPPRHLILLTLDTLRADRLGLYGNERELSPTLDALAARGVRFDDAIAQAIVTPPSHASILTGLNPPRHGLRLLAGQRLAEEQTTLAELLSAAGFRTAAFVSGKPLRPGSGLDQGFDFYDPVGKKKAERSALETNARIEEWLERYRGEATFLWIHYFDPHTPYLPPESYQKEFVGRIVSRTELVHGRTQNPDTSRMDGDPHPSANAIQTMRDLYDAEVRYMDDAIAQLFAMLDAAGILESAIVAIVADHGESLGEHGYYFGHWDALYENARVPMILARPDGRHGGRIVGETVRTIDIMPTVLEWLSLPVPANLDGRDLTPLIEGKESNPRYAYSEQNEFFPVYAIRGADWLLLQRSEVAQTGRAMELRLIAREQDERVSEDRSAEHPRIREEMEALLAADRFPASEAGIVTAPVSEELAEQLRALGYLPDEDDSGEDETTP